MVNPYYAHLDEPTVKNFNYMSCSEMAKPILKILGVSDEDLKGEAIEAIENSDRSNRYPYGSFHVGNVIKYLWRLELKGSPIENLTKAKSYLDRYLEIYKKLPCHKRLFNNKTDVILAAIFMIHDLIETYKQVEDEIYEPFVYVPYVEDNPFAFIENPKITNSDLYE